MESLTVRQAAEKWGLSPRTVQQLCTHGRIPGAQKFGKAWAIPADAEKSANPRRAQHQKNPAPAQPAPVQMPESGMLMPLMNTPFRPGHCRETAETMAAGPQRDIALAEYHYFSGQSELAAREAEPYLTSSHMGAKLSACLIYAYANLSLGRIQQVCFALEELNTALTAAGERSSHLQAASAFAAAAGAVLLHLPLPQELPDIQDFCLSSLRAHGPLPCMSMPITSICRGNMGRASALWRPPYPWARRNTPSPPSICIWWR